MAKNHFQSKSYISIDQITSVSQIKSLFSVADVMKNNVESHQVNEPLKGKSVAILFYQPSTRTFSSFLAAANRLGAYVTAIHGMQQYSSVSKGETLEDTIRSIYQTTAAHVIVLRHPDNNSAQVAAEISPVPVINAGSGTLEHPTQALLDLYTIYDHFGRLDNLKVVMVGDLLYGRTIKSLAKLLKLVGKNNSLVFVSPAELRAPSELVTELDWALVEQTADLKSQLKDADVVYMTRVQKEWFEKHGKLDQYERLKDKFVLTRHLVQQLPQKSLVLHPLPRVGEILYEVDEDHRAQYFQQMRSGLYVRMALLDQVLG